MSRRRRRWAGLLAFAAVVSLGGAEVHAGSTEQRRFALIIGNQRGGADTRPLMYAADDARRVHAVLTEVGQVNTADAILLLDRTAADVLAALADLERRAAAVRAQKQRSLLIVYYSGHAKEGALRLGDTRLPLDALRKRIEAAPADIQIGIFDSCRSGAVIRTKGARHAPAFQVISSGSDETRGLVLLSSSSADEDAQESDEIRGSYFSHHLVSGLRGDADRSGDRRVTLSEAYDYAYARTVADTAVSLAGAQHPTFSYELKGNADLVLTDVTRGKEGLYVPASAPEGTYYLVDRSGLIAAEIVKPATADRRIALRAGRYAVKRRLPDRLRIGQIQIASGQVATLDESTLRDAPFSDDPVKGARRGARISLGLGGTMQAFFDEPTRDGLFPPAGMLALELQVRDFFRPTWIWSVDVAFGGRDATLTEPASAGPVPYRFGELGVGTSLFTEWPLAFADGRLAPFLGARVALLLMTREFTGTSIPSQYFSTFSPGLVGGLRYRVFGDVAATARARVHYLLYNVDQNRSLGYWELAAALSYDF